MNRSPVALCATILSLAATLGVLTAPPALAVNHAPYVPSNLRIVEPRVAACPAASAPLSINAAPLFEARLTDTDGPVARIAARWEAYRTDTGARVWTGVTGFVANGQTARLRMDPTKVADGLTYRFRARAEDGSLASAWSGYCYFTVDMTAPSMEVQSLAYPRYDARNRYNWDPYVGGDRAFGRPGQAGTFELRPHHRDVVTFYYRLTGTSSWTAVPAVPNQQVNVPIAPTRFGLNVMELEAVDAAGNRGRMAGPYVFRVGGAPASVGQWQFNETSGTVAADSTAGGRTMEISGTAAASPWTRTGRMAGALELDGVDDVGQTTKAGINTATSFSVSSWVRARTMERSASMVSQSSDGRHGLSLRYDKSTNRWAFSRQDRLDAAKLDVVRSKEPVSTNVWTHLLGVYDATNGRIRFYVNGILQGDLKTTVPAWNAAAPLTVGRWDYAGVDGGPFRGAIDHLLVWNRALPADEVGPLFDARDAKQSPQPRLLAHWKLDETTGPAAQDSSGFGRELQVGQGADWVDDPERGRVLRLNARPDGGAMTAGPIFDGTGSFTVAVWARPDTSDGGAVVVQGTPGTTPGTAKPAFELGLTEVIGEWSEWGFLRTPRSGAETRLKYLVPLVDSPWVLLVGTYDSARNQVWFHANGGPGLDGERDYTLPWHAQGPVVFGKELPGSARTTVFSGAIDDIRIFAGTLTREQVESLYPPPSAGSPGVRR